LKTIKSIREIADFIGGEVVGNESDEISGVAKIESAEEGDLSFVSNPKYLSYLKTTKATAVFVKKDMDLDGVDSTNLILVDDPYFSICVILDAFFNPVRHPEGREEPCYVHKTAEVGSDEYIGAFAYIGEGAKIGNNVKIYPNVYVGRNVEIGDNTILYSGVHVYFDCKIGKDCMLHSGAVIGSDGFGHAPMPDGSYAKIPQIGNVILGDSVEIGAGCTIDRATMGSTIIKDGVKLDNLVQIAHNVEVGDNTVIAAQTGVSGSVKLGQQCVIGGQVGFVGHIQIANGTQIGAQSGIMKTIKEEGQQWLGSPIKNLRDEIKTQVIIRKLPQLYDKVISLEKQIKDKE
jgi:UDP-3-O-[3-hydroxymyristoyl] glucosamine N-acyltransferase